MRKRPVKQKRHVGAGAGVIVLLLVGVARSQSESDLDRTRQALEEGAGEAIVLVPHGSPENAPVPGARPPAIGPEEYHVPVGSLVREGAYLRDRRGRLIDVEGAWVMVFDPDEQGESDPPMILQPCMIMMEMSRLASSTAGPTPTFVVSGTVFAYRSRNFLLPDGFALVDYDAAPADRPERAADMPGPDDDQSRPIETDPRVEQLLEQMRVGTSLRPSPTTTGGAGVDAAEHEGDQPVREGLTVMNRVGRIVSGGGGYWTFVSDGGVEPSGHPPMRLLPCMNLMGIERVLLEHGVSVRFSLSGEVFTHGGVNYLLATAYRLELDREGNTVAAH